MRSSQLDVRYAAMLGKQAVAKVERVLRANPDKGCLRFHCCKSCRDGRLCHGENLAEAGRCIQRKWLEERRAANGAPAHEIGSQAADGGGTAAEVRAVCRWARRRQKKKKRRKRNRMQSCCSRIPTMPKSKCMHSPARRRTNVRTQKTEVMSGARNKRRGANGSASEK